MRPLTAVVSTLALFACPSATPPAGGDSGTPLTCTAPQRACGAACSNVATDNANCGECGIACPADQSCAGGRCYARGCGTVSCAGTHVCLDGLCVERACFGVACDGGSLCAGGTCQSVSCGGVACGTGEVCSNNACIAAACAGVLCPPGARCANGACERDTCDNGLEDGDESDVDCGGICRACQVGAKCTQPDECTALVCTGGICDAPSCVDHVRNGTEGDVDCGGTCLPCAAGRRCAGALQCESQVCTAGTCAPATCTDTVENGLETDRDCGGNCPPCVAGLGCTQASDCASQECQLGKCVSATCRNGVKDGAETDLDCGGTCQGCTTGQSCNAGQDCIAQICDATKHCANPTCVDSRRNGTESDIDCGGTCPTKCTVGKLCALPADCVTLSCRVGSCAAATCGDAIKNGSESDLDCGGGMCPRCNTGRACGSDLDCLYNACDGGFCLQQGLLRPPVAFDLGVGASDLEVADLDGDGKSDVAAINETSFDVYVYFGAPDGGLTAGPTLQVGNAQGARPPVGIGIGDVTGDGRLDIVTARPTYVGCSCCYSQYGNCVVGVAPGAGNRTFLGMSDTLLANPASYSGCGYRVATGRMDADARAEIIVGDELRNCPGNQCGNWFGDSVGGYLVHPDSTSGVLQPLQSLAQAGPFVAVGDVNADGNLDVVGRSTNYSRLRVFLGNGTGTFSPGTDSAVSPGSGEMVLARIDADNRLDIAVASKASNRVGVALGVGNGAFLAPSSITVASPDGVAVADFNADGKFDVAVGGIGIVLLRGHGDGTFDAPETYFPQLGDVLDLATGDFNGDGKPDLVGIANNKAWLLINAL